MPETPNTDATNTRDTNRQNRTVPQSSKSDIIRYLDNQTLRTNPFKNSLTADHIYQRAERISSALFLITSHIESVEPIRTSIREYALRLIDMSLKAQSYLRSDTSEVIHEFLGLIRTLVTRVRLAGIAGFISQQNMNVLTSALDELGQLVASAQKSTLSDIHPLFQEDFLPRTGGMREERVRRTETPEHKGHKGQEVRPVQTDRSERIVAILSTGDLFGIRDLAVQLPEFSEKMIQRELALLVDAGRVRKVGAKRWSRYGVIRAGQS